MHSTTLVLVHVLMFTNLRQVGAQSCAYTDGTTINTVFGVSLGSGGQCCKCWGSAVDNGCCTASKPYCHLGGGQVKNCLANPLAACTDLTGVTKNTVYCKCGGSTCTVSFIYPPTPFKYIFFDENAIISSYLISLYFCTYQPLSGRFVCQYCHWVNNESLTLLPINPCRSNIGCYGSLFCKCSLHQHGWFYRKYCHPLHLWLIPVQFAKVLCYQHWVFD
jgi:hypothetical protein